MARSRAPQAWLMGHLGTFCLIELMKEFVGYIQMKRSVLHVGRGWARSGATGGWLLPIRRELRPSAVCSIGRRRGTVDR
jgi:hypothetical protein